MNSMVTIIGGGHQGLSMAAHLSLYGIKCFLWNRTKRHIQSIINTKAIKCNGIINGTAYIEGISTNITDNLQKLIMVTTPSFAHKDIARLLAPFVDETYTIVLNPGRTFGILEFVNTLKESGCKSIPLVAETQTILYTCRRVSDDSVTIYALKKNILIATQDIRKVDKVLSILPECIRKYFTPARSYVETSLGNVGMILHCAPVLMNIGWIENRKVDFKYYYDGITQSICKVLERLDKERLMAASAMGYPVESVTEWIDRIYGTCGSCLYEKLQNNPYYKEIDAPGTIHHRYITEDVPYGLVPLESVGKVLHIDTPISSLIIDLANIVMSEDYRKTGRIFHIGD